MDLQHHNSGHQLSFALPPMKDRFAFLEFHPDKQLALKITEDEIVRVRGLIRCAARANREDLLEQALDWLIRYDRVLQKLKSKP